MTTKLDVALDEAVALLDLVVSEDYLYCSCNEDGYDECTGTCVLGRSKKVLDELECLRALESEAS